MVMFYMYGVHEKLSTWYAIMNIWSATNFYKIKLDGPFSAFNQVLPTQKFIDNTALDKVDLESRDIIFFLPEMM